ncbi:helix-turn-helix transcriptional regulator [bacterium]|nr:helix-turn-helix transcriptional regulator [bacterium]
MNKKEILKEFGKILGAERNRAGLSQDELAAQAGICAGKHIGKIERGEANPSLYTVISIMNTLNISFDKLFSTKI